MCRCSGAGNLRDDILYYSKELAKFTDGDDEHRSYIMDMGIKALRLVSTFSKNLNFQEPVRR